MTMIPATTLKMVRLASKKFPTAVADAPSAIKTTENPAANASELRKMRPMSSVPGPDFISSTEAPESIDMYPGTSGRTQGERNETTPARGCGFVPFALRPAARPRIHIDALRRFCRRDEVRPGDGAHGAHLPKLAGVRGGVLSGFYSARSVGNGGRELFTRQADHLQRGGGDHRHYFRPAPDGAGENSSALPRGAT